MYIDIIFNPGSTVGNSDTFVLHVITGGKAVIINESSANLIFDFSNGSQGYVPSYDRRLFHFCNQMSVPTGQVRWTIQSVVANQLNANNVVVEVYEPSEQILEAYPSPLVRQLLFST